MKKSELTVRDAVKFARHDFLNELQLILMHIDLDNAADARTKILDTTERMRKEAHLSGLGLPALETWILTFDWNQAVYTKHLDTNIGSSATTRKADDQVIVTFLNKLFLELENNTDPFNENIVDIVVSASEADWKVTLTLPGQTAPIEWSPAEEDDWTAELYKNEEYWTFTISGQ
ncbi:Spo0B domain-containing protein [Sporosarcina aquimarina]|uniref:Spo0B domain-containing protein n=1 Tax=Sporosarcina aquimarina TaxID=114975 RepID=A0ABU4FY31_9BACL|nr:Spo0B domain-containing protein [Sporosarcina aquimarina]MDW0109626.1 Spo0B domain-containing protein [Sporosarcina aquimarina]